MFTPYSIFHIYSNLFDHLDQVQASQFKFVTFGPPVFSIVLFKINPKFDQIRFIVYLK